jgi:predicted SnoaL-like aldol condensation-catalyzing enzyme
MASELAEKNKALVLKAFDALFNKRDYEAAERYWSPNYIQHSAPIAPGREGLFDLVKSLPPTLKYEAGTIVAEGKFVIVHGRFRDSAPLQIGSLPTSCASRMDYSSNTGT